ncbi:MAG: ATP-binding protein, partial [Leucobacter sp.]
LGGCEPSAATGFAANRIEQEALTNAVRHAGASRVRVVLERRAAPEAALVVIVEDDGRGFDAADAPRGSGLAGMRERAALLGGTVEIGAVEIGTVEIGTVEISAVEIGGAGGRGTRVVAELPWGRETP